MSLQAGITDASVRAGLDAEADEFQDSLDLGGVRLVGIEMPAAWTTADLTFVSAIGPVTAATVWLPVYDAAGTELEVMAAAGRIIGLDARDSFPFERLRVRSGSAATAVNQAAARDLVAILHPV